MKKIIELIIIAALLVIFLFIGTKKMAAVYYNKGALFFDQQNYKQAKVYFQKSLKMNPNQAFVHYTLAEAYRADGEVDLAITEYKKTLKVDPVYYKAYCMLAQIYAERQDYPEALKILEAGLNKIPQSFEIEKLLSEVRFSHATDYLSEGVEAFLSGDKTSAFTALNNAREIKPDYAHVYYTLGYFYYSEGNLTEAREKLQQAIEVDPNFWMAHRLLGSIYFAQGNHSQAIQEFKSALAVNSQDPYLNNDLGLALMETERYSEAIIYLQEAIRLSPGNPNFHYSLASVYRDNKMLPEAKSEYQKLLELAPDYPNIFNDLAGIYKQEGKILEVKDAYLREIKNAKGRLASDPKDAFAWNSLAVAYLGSAEYALAKDAINNSLAIQPNNRDTYLILSDIQQNLRETDAALDSLKKAKAISTPVKFIDQGITQLKKELGSVIASDKVYLKNGRMLNGRIKQESADKLVLETYSGTGQGEVTLYKDDISRIVREAE